MEVRRTLPVKLALDAEDRVSLHETIEQFRWAANYVVEQACREDDFVITDRRALHDRTYEAVRERTELHANHVQAARNCAADALSSVVTTWQDGKRASMPTFTAPFLEYDKRSATFHDDHASLATVDGRIGARYVLPDPARDTPHSQYLDNDDYELTGASLHYRNASEAFYLHLRTMAELDDPEPVENGTVLGVDLGVEHIAVTSTGVFWSGAELNHWHREYEKRRASLQQRGTRDAHENIQAVGRQETGRFEQLLHRVANGIAEEAADKGCSHIAFEELTGIRDRMPGAKLLHGWAFHRLIEYVTYKAEVRGIRVEQVEPQHTSQRCSACGHTEDANRPARDRFSCQACGYRNHADYNAAKNIAYRLLRTQNGGEGGAPVGVGVNGGAMTASGDYTALPVQG